MSKTKVSCPNCGYEIDVQNILSHQLEEDIRRKYQEQLANEKKKFESESQKLEEAKKDFESKKKRENELFQERLEQQIRKEKQALKTKLEEKIREEQSDVFKDLQKELEEKTNQIKELNRAKAEIEKLKRDNQLAKEKAEAEAQTKINEVLAQEKAKIQKLADEKNELKLKEMQKQLEDQRKLTEEMKRKQEQGSMQLQGEVQELALEEMLAHTYPFDTIQEVPKGIRGADCVQIVYNALQQECGSIVYESKRTKNFAKDWIDKLKQDQLACKADVAILVTQVLPSDMERFGEKDGIWICTYPEVKSLSFVLRQMLLKLHGARTAEENKGEKMEMLYHYLTSPEFVQTVNRIIENYDGMVQQLNSEKKAMHKLWSQREKQIWAVQENISGLFGSIKGIAGNAIGNVPSLELPGTQDELEL